MKSTKIILPDKSILWEDPEKVLLFEEEYKLGVDGWYRHEYSNGNIFEFYIINGISLGSIDLNNPSRGSFLGKTGYCKCQIEKMSRFKSFF